MELSSTSNTLWCKPRSSGSPIYIPGRLRTASKPSSLSIFEASYFSAADVAGLFSSPAKSDFLDIKIQRKLDCERQISGGKFYQNYHFYTMHISGILGQKNTISCGGFG